MVLVLLCSLMTMTAFAADETGSIVINGVSENNRYDVYQMLELESYNKDENIYTYKILEKWKDFFKEESESNSQLFEINGSLEEDDDVYVNWKGTGDHSDFAEAFARRAMEYAEEKGIDPVKSSANGEFTIPDGSDIGTFNDLELGYYLIDSDVGILCALTTTNPTGYVYAKNGSPTITKQVQEDSTGQWDVKNTAGIGETVHFRSTITVHDGAENYVLHDEMSEGLTFTEITAIRHLTPITEEDNQEDTGNPGVTYANGYKSTVVPNDNNQHYTVYTDADNSDGCDFEIHFTQNFCDHLQTADYVVVEYTAVLNEKAVIGSDDGDINTAKLTYGENKSTVESTTNTYTYKFDLVKTDGNNKVLGGAEEGTYATFKIFDAPTGGNQIYVEAATKEATGAVFYRVTSDPTNADVLIRAINGVANIEGLDSGIYYLQEEDAPDGYNKLQDRQRFTINDSNATASWSNNGDYVVNSGVQVINGHGTLMPETGGIGTTLFYVVGGFLVAAAVVLLITKTRMKAED